jgi:Cu/Ag efflux protein CusF
MFGVFCALVVVLALTVGNTVAAEEKAVDATIVKIDGDKITVKVGEKEQTVDVEKDKIKLFKGKDKIKLTDLKDGDKIKVNQNKDGKVTVIRAPK